MKKILIICTLVFVNACAAQPNKNGTEQGNVECDVSFHKLEQCVYRFSNHEVAVKVASENIAEDEKLLTNLSVKTNDTQQVLTISPDTSMLEGDIGYISFADINFDGVPDLAITTSFGAANLYLDYWIFNVQQKKYLPIGNYPQLIINEQKKTLKATVKSSADDYKVTEWRWTNDKLEQL